MTEALLLIVTLLVAGAMAGLTAGLFGNGGGFVVGPQRFDAAALGLSAAEAGAWR